MTDEREVLAVEGVRFFGEMCASISHEIKNVLAIINENAGLLQDIISMQEKGIPMAPERLSRLARSISRQVNRGDGIVKGMNRFAHSTDVAVETVDVGELVQFMARLAGRLIGLKGQAPSIETFGSVPTVVINRFFLENLVWRCVCRAMDACPPGEAVSIRIDRIDNHVRIRFGGLDRKALTRIPDFPSIRESAIADLLNAGLALSRKSGEICIILS